ncbi:unnamed protein product, partial [marine sediment metagenome]
PFKITVPLKVDIVLITHPHYDHCSLEDIEKVVKEDTVVIAPPDCTSKFVRNEKGNLKIITPGKIIEIGDIKIQAVPAYNTNKTFHPKENEWCGYIIAINNKIIYHAGDTDLIPEMDKIQADIALLPIGGTYTMNAEEAAQAAQKVKAKVVIPCHYTKGIAGSPEDAERLKQLLPDKVIIPD